MRSKWGNQGAGLLGKVIVSSGIAGEGRLTAAQEGELLRLGALLLEMVAAVALAAVRHGAGGQGGARWWRSRCCSACWMLTCARGRTRQIREALAWRGGEMEIN